MRDLKTTLRRIAAAVLPERPLGALRTLWYRSQALDPRRLRLESWFKRLNAEAAGDQIVLRPGLRFTIDPEAREGFEWFCFRSPELVRELDGFLARSATCHRLLDVGACHGLFSLAFAHGRDDAQALAVEPSPLAWAVLEANVRRNPDARIVPVQAALGEEPGLLRMRFAWHHLEASPDAEDQAGTVTIPLRTLDDLCSEMSFHPDVMKIDVEGYEIAVLRGARRTLTEDRPILFLEAHPQRLRELGRSVGELGELLVELGYLTFDLKGAPVSARELANLDAVSRFYCSPAEASAAKVPNLVYNALAK
jgi:FkbM family methyltransferase